MHEHSVTCTGAAGGATAARDTLRRRSRASLPLTPVAVRAVRGATQLDADDREHMLERVAEMVLDAMDANGLEVDDFISVIFTATSHLGSEFPAHAPPQPGLREVPLPCARGLHI